MKTIELLLLFFKEKYHNNSVMDVVSITICSKCQLKLIIIIIIIIITDKPLPTMDLKDVSSFILCSPGCRPSVVSCHCEGVFTSTVSPSFGHVCSC